MLPIRNAGTQAGSKRQSHVREHRPKSVSLIPYHFPPLIGSNLTDGKIASRGKAIEMEDVKFHQCVRLSRFENDRTISFIPPDGEFELMSYRLSTPVKPLIWAEAAIESHKGSRIEYMVKVKAQFKRRSTANNVEVYVPVPDDASTPRFRAATGSVQYAPDKSAFVWKIKQLGGGKEFLMRAHFGLPSVRGGAWLFPFAFQA